MWLFSMRKSLSRAQHARQVGPSFGEIVALLPHVWSSTRIARTESCTYKKSEPQKRTRYQAVNGDFRSIQKAPAGGAPLRSQTFLKAQLCSESLNPALCARSLKAVRQALACSTSPGWHRGRPGSHRQGARNHHAELPTPAAAAPTRPAT